ncbi:MAG: hypothetical protein ACOY93_03685 [Bacillota bacterium]
MRPELEQSLFVEFEELFALRERLRSVADQLRAHLLAAGLRERLEPEIFDQELEFRGTEGSNLLIRLDSYRLEITGARPEIAIHALAAIILAEAEVFRLTSVELGLSAVFKADQNHPLNLAAQAFTPVEEPGEEPMLDRRFAMTWDWGTATTGFSFHAADTEGRELFLSFKAREGYMTLPELQSGAWVGEQTRRFEQLVRRFLAQLGWKS